MTTQQQPYRLHDLDDLLAPTLRSATGSVRDVALAVLVNGIAAGHKPDRIRGWIRTQKHHGALIRYVNIQPRFDDVTRAATAAVHQPPSPRAAAERLIGRLLLPSPDWVSVSGAVEVKARGMFAVVGLEVLASARGERGPKAMNTALVGNGVLGVKVNATGKTVASRVGVIESARWAHRTKKQHRGATRWALNVLPPEVMETAEYRHHWTIEALADGTAEPVADLIRAATHPAIAYGVGWGPWLWGVCDAAGVDPLAVGLSETGTAVARRAWQKVVGDLPVVEALDAYDRAYGCSAARDRKESERLASNADSEVARTAHQAMVKTIEALLTDLPTPGDRAVELAWFRSVEGRCDGIGEGLDGRRRVGLRRQARARVASRMVRVGYADHQAARVSARIVPETVVGEVA